MGRVITKLVGTSANVFAKRFKPVSQRTGYINTLFFQCKSKIMTEYMPSMQEEKKARKRFTQEIQYNTLMGTLSILLYTSILPVPLKVLIHSTDTIRYISLAKINSHNLQIYKYTQICFNFF